MRRNRIYSAKPIAPITFETGPGSHELEGPPAHYLRTVLRQKPGAEVILFDGTGGEYLCRLASLDRKKAVFDVVQHNPDNKASPLNITLAIGVSRGDRMDYGLQKATELGVRAIQPLNTQRSEAKLDADRLAKREAHWNGVITSACEQCGLNVLPDLQPTLTADDWCVSLADDSSHKIVLQPNSETSSASKLIAGAKDNRTICLAVGPEGGFTEQEVDSLQAAGFQAMALGPRILRTETAPIAMLGILQFLLGDFQSSDLQG